MTIRSHEYRGEDDYDRIVELLRESFETMGPWFNWGPEHWHMLHAYNCQDQPGWKKDLRLWETAEGRLIGVVTPEDPGCVYLQVHPRYREIEPEMLAWTEERIGSFDVFAAGWDEYRQGLLAARGYADKGPALNNYRLRLDRPVPVGQVPPGYTLRTANRLDPEERLRMEQTSIATWGRDREPDLNRPLRSARTRFYRPDLDMVVEAPDGSIASYCTIWFDPVLRYGVFEPVGTHPAHRRLGLTKAMMLEAIRRVKTLGATAAYVTSRATSEGANALYRSVTGSPPFATDWCWGRTSPGREDD